MRLTLRTLLAYLDDTLEPTQAKLIGQKVAESDTAQELIARIKEVTRRRRITSPSASGPGAKVDPNSIAEYLDNELSTEQLAEIEQLALDSDVHLAEIASCHQILTIVLGEPAVVPPTAYKRMYGLVKAPESNPSKQAPAQAETEEGPVEGHEVDETLRLGLPAWRGAGSWSNRLILGGGMVCVLGLLAVAIWQLLPSFVARETDSANNATKPAETAKLVLPGEAVSPKDKTIPKAELETKTKGPELKEKVPDKLPEVKGKKDDAKEKSPEVAPKKENDTPPPPPNLEVREVAIFEPPTPPGTTVLLQRSPSGPNAPLKPWTRLLRSNPAPPILSNATLVSLPGYRSVVQTAGGIRLTLWGNVPEFMRFPIALESVATLHPSSQVDLDVTLERGRFALSNPKDQPLTARIRFANPTKPDKGQIWDVTLESKGTEAVFNLVGVFPPGEMFFPKKDSPRRAGPIAVAVLVVTSGSANVRIDLQAPIAIAPPPDGAILTWNSAVGTPETRKNDTIPHWATEVMEPLAPGADAKARLAVKSALDTLNLDLTNTPVDRGLLKAMQSTDTTLQRLAVRAAGAIEDLPRVIDALENKDIEVRRAAIETLRIWIASGTNNDYRLFDQLKTTYTPQDAELVMSLLHNFTAQQEADPNFGDLLTHNLVHKKIAIRELAHDYLLRLYRAGDQIHYSATAPEEQVVRDANAWRSLVQQQREKKS